MSRVRDVKGPTEERAESKKEFTMAVKAYLAITMNIDPGNREQAAGVYAAYSQPTWSADPDIRVYAVA